MGNIRLKKMNRDVLQRYVDELSIDLSAKSVKAIFSMIKLCLKAAYNSRLIENIFDNIRLPKTVSKEVKVLTKQEQEKSVSYTHLQWRGARILRTTFHLITLSSSVTIYI